MSEETIVAIVRRLQKDKKFREKVLGSKTEEEIRHILETLKHAGIQATQEDLLYALKIDTLIEKITETKFDLGLELQKGLGGVVKQIDEGYKTVMKMYIVAFYLGIFLILVSVFASLVLHSDASALILGGLGMADIIASLIFRPAQNLQNSRGNLAQLQAAFFNWINDISNWNRYLQLVENEATSNTPSPAFTKMCEVSEMMVQNTACMMDLVERYCEMYESPIGKERRDSKWKAKQLTKDQKQESQEDATK